jgi:ERCC4-related helicase
MCDLQAFNINMRKVLNASKGLDKNKYHPKIERMDWFEDCDAGRSPSLSHSAKSLKLRDILTKSLKKAPLDKIIVFTEWKAFTAIAGRILEENGIQFVYYTVCGSPHISVVTTNQLIYL